MLSPTFGMLFLVKVSSTRLIAAPIPRGTKTFNGSGGGVNDIKSASPWLMQW